MKTAVLDIETRSVVDLKKVGAWRYATDPTTAVWCVGWALDDQPVRLWVPGEPVPEAIASADVVVAHNSGFEIAISQHILVPRYGWPKVSIEKWRCTMAMALALALPASLDKVAKVLSLPEQKANKTIVSLMAAPRRPRGDEDPNGTYWFDDDEHLAQLYAYCRQDVETERELFRRLLPLSETERELWRLDQVINIRGFYVDGDLPEKANAIVTAAERAIQDELQQITGGEIETTHQVKKLLVWLAARGCEVNDLQKGTLAHALRRTDLSPEARRVIELRREAAHASAAKMPALRAWRCVDGRVRGAFKFHGTATGRWSGSGPQPQNFRKETGNTEAKLAAVMTGDIEAVRKVPSP
jgi:DNA polymerase